MRLSRGIIARATFWTLLGFTALPRIAQAEPQPAESRPTETRTSEPPPPAARPVETVQERAELLFNQGLVLMKSDHCKDAIPLFAKSQELDPAAATLVNLATCYDRLGKTASAYQTYQQASRAAILEGKPELQRRTDQALATLAPTLTRLRVVPLGDASARTIRINGATIQDLREPIPLDPGENIIEASAPGREPWHRTVVSPPAGSLLVIEVPDLRAGTSAVTATSPSTNPMEPTVEQQGPRADTMPWIIVAAGVGAASFAVSAGFALSASSKYDDASAHCAGNSCTKEGIQLRDQAGNRADVATWAFGLGLISAASAGVLWFTSKPKERKSAVEIHPWILPGHGTALAGVSLGGAL